MSAEYEIIIDDQALMEALRDPHLVAGPVREFLIKGALEIEGEAKELAVVDTGRMRGSIRSRLGQLEARVGPTVHYAPHVEFDTRPHWAPVGALQPWASRHGFGKGKRGDAIVRAIIAKRGTKAHPFMRPGLEAARPAIEGHVRTLGTQIRANFDAHARGSAAGDSG